MSCIARAKETQSKLNSHPCKQHSDVRNHHAQNTPAVLQLCRNLGNQAMLSLSNPCIIHRKLIVGKPNDKYERAAVWLSEPFDPTYFQAVPRETVLYPSPLKISRPGDKSEKEADLVSQTLCTEAPHKPIAVRQKLDTKNTSTISSLLEARILERQAQGRGKRLNSTALHSETQKFKCGGQPLRRDTRNFFEICMGQDFSQVRIHVNNQAAETAELVQAKAYTLGNDIVFGVGQYSPESSTGRQLLAHELTHVVQQNHGAPMQIARQPRTLEKPQFTEELSEATTRKQLVTPPTTIAKAIEYLEEAKQADRTDPRDSERAYKLVYSTEQLVGHLVDYGKVHKAFAGKGINLTYAVLLCDNANAELFSARLRLRRNRPLRGLWQVVIGSMKVAKEYLEIANGEMTFEQSTIASTVDQWKWAHVAIPGAIFVAYVTLVVGGPLVVGELKLMGSAAVTAGRIAWGLYLKNPEAGLAIAEYAIGTVLGISADGLDKYLEQMTTPEGFLSTVFEIMIIRQAMGGGRCRVYKGEVRGTPKGNRMEVKITEGPLAAGKTTTPTEPPPVAEPVAKPVPPIKSTPPSPPKSTAIEAPASAKLTRARERLDVHLKNMLEHDLDLRELGYNKREWDEFRRNYYLDPKRALTDLERRMDRHVVRAEMVKGLEVEPPEGFHLLGGRTAARAPYSTLRENMIAEGYLPQGEAYRKYKGKQVEFERDFDAHHIVLKSDSEMIEKLYNVGIKQDDAINGVWLPRDVTVANKCGGIPHMDYIHKNSGAYMNAVRRRLRNLKSRIEIVNELRKIADELSNDLFKF
ncbi:MAG: DUF4157 domain-containing protein [Candidatus Hodarchaeota archaeon]